MYKIPKIDDSTLETLAAQIKPVFRFVQPDGMLSKVEVDEPGYAAGQLYDCRQPTDLRTVGVNSQPEPLMLADDLKVLAEIYTLHTIGSHLNASVAEVLAQIPVHLLETTVAFEVTHKWPAEVVDNFDRRQGLRQQLDPDSLASYYRTITILYGKR
jgi:hypothetical protein